MIVGRRARGVDKLDLLLNSSGIEIVSVDRAQSLVARQAYTRFGKGNHFARLNPGGGFSYALSVTTGEPVLFKGNDFSQTDVEIA